MQLFALVSTACLCGAVVAQEDPMTAVAEQAAALETAPELSTGTLRLTETELENGVFVWILVEQTGLYSLATDTPGALVLGSIPSSDGRYDGTTAAQQHVSSMSRNNPPALGPLLLSPAHPYLLSVSSTTGATMLKVTLLEALPDLSTVPEDGATVAAGDTLYAPESRINLVLPAVSSPSRIEVIAEPRANLSARLGSETVPAGGRYPWLSENETKLSIDARAGEASAPPRVLVRLGQADAMLDESEPNEERPNPVSVGTAFKGHLLQGDEDRLTFSLEEKTPVSLTVATGNSDMKFTIRLFQVTADDEQLLWKRSAGSEGLRDETLWLPAGDFRLDLARDDGTAQPLPYTLSLVSTAAPGANDEAEPNDTPQAAMPLPDSLRVSGSAFKGDVDMYLFSVPDDLAQNLWRIFTVNAASIELFNEGKRIARVDANSRRTMLDALALLPGDYRIGVKAEGDYILRIMDLGARPSDYEGEPNDSQNEGQRLAFGHGVRGGFHRDKDLDYYLFRLDMPSAVEIIIRPASDGEMDVKLFIANHQTGRKIAFKPGDGPYHFRSTLQAGDWTLVVRALKPAIQEQYEVTVNRLPALAGHEPDDQPLDAVKLPLDGDIAGSVGAFDGKDQVFVPLPRGEGLAAMVCAAGTDTRPGRWRLYNWSDDSAVAEVRDGIALFSYGPGLGGALRFELDGMENVIDYRCALRFPPTSAPPKAEPPVQQGDEPVVLAHGQTRRVSIEAEGPEPSLELGMEPGELAFVACRDGRGQALGPETRVWAPAGASTPTRELFGELQAIVAEAEPKLEFRRVYAERIEGAALPFDVDCTLYGIDDLPRLSDMGPVSEFRMIKPAASAEQKTESAAAAPPSPGLEALIARETPERQPEGDLPVDIRFETLPDLAAFNEAGQRFRASMSLENRGEAALEVKVSSRVDGEGWRIEPRTQSLSINPGNPVRVDVDITAPPWLSPSLKPALAAMAEAGDSFAAEMVEFPVSTSAVAVNPFTYWQAPETLRGGLNVLNFFLGARLIQWGDQIPDVNKQEGERALHDGLAPHGAGVNVPKTITFQLAATAELAGAMIQLRSTTGEERWPAAVEVFVPAADGSWARIASSALESVHAPQYLVFDDAVTTDKIRFHFPRCWSPCNEPYVQEIQAIATPGTHPEGLPPINVADPDLGGHVVWSTDRFGGPWNREFLVGDPATSNSGWPLARPEPLQATIAFHHNRAALVRSVNWVADPDDTARIPEAQVDASLEGPNGPWLALGRLPAPRLGELRSTLTLKSPEWARYLRFTFDIREEGRHFGPDSIEVIEDTGTSVLGLWEDDQPRAAYEAAVQSKPTVAVPPAGGPSREAAVALSGNDAVHSSVVIERNEDWWRIEADRGAFNRLRLSFGQTRPLVVPELYDVQGGMVALEEKDGSREVEAVIEAGTYYLRIFEPPRSVVISWDTSPSVGKYIPRTLAAVRTWGRGLQPGRDALQLLPFGPRGFLLDDWAETSEALDPVLAALPEEGSSDSEKAMLLASEALKNRRGSRGIVIMTDAETGMNPDLWPVMLKAMPRVVSLSVDSDGRQNAAVMMDWAGVNGGHFQRVIGPLGLADSMEMANSLFRAPKAYSFSAAIEALVEPEGETQLTILPAAGEDTATGAIELILDASGSMLQRMEGRRRIDIAHDALAGLVRDTLPDGTPFAFRAFGLEEDACRSELVVPLGPLNRDAAAEAIEAVPAINLAKTAIADSLRAAADDLAQSAAPRVVVLVTDGEETCEGDPEAAIADLRNSGLDARLNIVGFAIDDEALAKTFAAWAETGGGSYFNAGGAEALEQSIADALRPRFDIVRTYLDGRTELVGKAALGETVMVPAGQLSVTPGSGASGEAVTLQASPGVSVSLDYRVGSGLARSDGEGSP